jgi:MoaA/NifB/PqqE/SkfB family radical SAM enzyme
MLSIGSEPLTSPHFTQILERASQHGVPELGFYTNGLLMKERIVEAILEHGVTIVAVSVDGATKRTFEAIRRGADFAVLLRNIRRLATRRAALGRVLPRIRFGIVMMRSNIEELEEIVTLAWRMGAEEVNFFHMVAYDGLGMERESLVHHKALSNR